MQGAQIKSEPAFNRFLQLLDQRWVKILLRKNTLTHRPVRARIDLQSVTSEIFDYSIL